MIFDPASRRAPTRSAYKRINPPIFTRRLFVSLILLVPVIGCFQPSSVGETCDAIVGDLVVSEFLPNPAGSDYDREWFEIYNASSRPQVLDRLVVRRYGFYPVGSCNDESDQPGTACISDSECINSCRTASCVTYCDGPFTEAEDGRMVTYRNVIRGAGVLEPHGYFVLSDGPRVDINADYNYALRGHDNPATKSDPSLVTESLGDFSQDIGGLGIACQGQVVDEIFYGTREGLPIPVGGQTLSPTPLSTMTHVGGVQEPSIPKMRSWERVNWTRKKLWWTSKNAERMKTALRAGSVCRMFVLVKTMKSVLAFLSLRKRFYVSMIWIVLAKARLGRAAMIKTHLVPPMANAWRFRVNARIVAKSVLTIVIASWGVMPALTPKMPNARVSLFLAASRIRAMVMLLPILALPGPSIRFVPLC